MNKTFQIAVPILPKGNNPIGIFRPKTITVASRRAGRTSAMFESTEAMNEAFKTYFHPGVLQRGQTQTEE